MTEVRKLGLSLLFVMSNHVLPFHPYVARSSFTPAQHDNKEQHSIDSDADESHAMSHAATERDKGSSDEFCDRSSAFVIDDYGAMGHVFYISVREAELGTQVLHGCTVQVPAGDKFCNVLTFIHEMPPIVRSQLESWVATLNTPTPLTFLFRGDDINGPNEFKGGVESLFRAVWHVLTIGQ